jgi:hypothetical protein
MTQKYKLPFLACALAALLIALAWPSSTEAGARHRNSWTRGVFHHHPVVHRSYSHRRYKKHPYSHHHRRHHAGMKIRAYN